MKTESKKGLLIRFYTPEDYMSVRQLYEESGWFDSETDAEDRLTAKIKRDKDSILVAFDGKNILGTVSLVEDGRIALFFRLISTGDNAVLVRKHLLEKGMEIFKKRGYREAHIISPEGDLERQGEYENFGFQKGDSYRWMWVKIG